MYWIALSPSRDEERTAWGWRCLQFTPRVAWMDELLVMEISATERLWGGRRKLVRQLLNTGDVLSTSTWSSGSTSRVAMALLRMKVREESRPASIDDLPLWTLTEARPHVAILERMGCRTWGDLKSLPRAGVARRFGATLVASMDRAYGQEPEAHDWISLPQVFDLNVELVCLAVSAPELMWAAQRLLSQLQVWLQGRNLGVLAIELEWTLDLRRMDGKPLPPTESLQIRTSRPTQDMAHLRKLVNEHLSRASISAPANHLRIRTLETSAWGGIPASLLPEDNKPGERLHQFVERLSVRLGEDKVLVAQMQDDHRPEKMQTWVPARKLRVVAEKTAVNGTKDVILPTWLLPQPVLLQTRSDVPQYGGPLRRLTRLYRIETGWWEEGGPAFRDYFIARSDEAGLVWIYRERPSGESGSRWFLQGIYA